jgi:hypothetical protein
LASAALADGTASADGGAAAATCWTESSPIAGATTSVESRIQSKRMLCYVDSFGSRPWPVAAATVSQETAKSEARASHESADRCRPNFQNTKFNFQRNDLPRSWSRHNRDQPQR